jgi:probable addiction module antidote protein
MKTLKPAKGQDYHEWLVTSLKSKKEAAGYLNAAWQEGERKYFLKALRNVVEAQGGMSKVAAKAKLTREGLYRMLSEDGNPEWESINRILVAIGMRPVFHFEPVGPPR